MKIIGLDLGVATIGWAYIEEPGNGNQEFRILGMGTRVVPYNLSNPTELSDFARGKAYSTNQNRRIKRGIRRSLGRYQLRSTDLAKKLADLGMLPDEALFALKAIDLYSLRSKALQEKISLQEIGRIFMHLNQRRGYKSSRKTGQNDKSEYLKAISDLEKGITENNQTIGQFFYEQLCQNEHYRIKEKIFMRASYIAEFNKIWESQRSFYPDVLTDENLRIIRDDIIYRQRPLKSQKDLVSNCRFEVNHKVSPKSSPLFQWFKSWQNINHLEIEYKHGKDKQERNRPISLKEKQGIFELLENNAKVSASKILKSLGLSDREYSLNFKDLQGNLTLIRLKELLPNRPDLWVFAPKITGTKNGEEILESPDDKNKENLRLHQLWHLLHSIDAPQDIIKTLLKAPYNLNQEEAETLANCSFQQGFSNMSARAMRKLLPKMMQGLNYSDACQAMGYNHSGSETKEDKAKKEYASALQNLKKGELRNPIVEKIINQVINVVNKLIEVHGKPDEIRVELARGLKENAEKRENADKTMRENEKRNANYAERIRELGIIKVSKKDIIKYHLWQEFGGVSPYESSHPVPLAALFSNEYEVEHIIPKSRLFDDSFTNKTIARRSINSTKNNLTALEYMQSLSAEKLASYESFVLGAYNDKKISKAKRDRLLMLSKDVPDDFINRQLQDTRYITRTVKTLLEAVCRNVSSTTGSVTDYLRNTWGLDEVIQNLNWHKYEALDRVTQEIGKDGKVKNKITDWSKREDHRNHAVDAFIVACSKQGYIQQLNTMNQNYQHYAELRKSGRIFEPPMQHLTQVLQDATAQILISFKAGKKVGTWKKASKSAEKATLVPRGALHEESIYGKNSEGRYTIRYSIDQNFDKVERIINPDIRRLVQARLEQFNNDPKKAFKDLENNPIYFNQQKGIIIKAVKCYARLENAEELKRDENDHVLGYVKLGNNHHVSLYRNEKGKLVEDVVTFWAAVERKRAGNPIINREPKDGSKFVVSMQINEMFVFGLTLDELKTSIDEKNNKLISKHLYRVQKLATSYYVFRHHIETSGSDESIKAQKLNKMIRIQSLEKMNGIKVKINHIGEIEIRND